MDKLLQKKQKAMQGKKSTFMRLVVSAKQAVKACSGKADQDVPDFSNQATSPFGQLIKKYNFCQAKIIREEIRKLRGAVCALCAPPAKFADYFDTTNAAAPKLKVTSSSFEEWAGQMDTDLNCMDEVQNAVTTQLIDKINALDTSAKCTKFRDNLKNTLQGTDNKPCQGQNCKNLCKTKASMFGSGCTTVMDGKDVTVSNTRLLADIYGDYEPGTTGANMEIGADSDSTIVVDGVAVTDTTI